MLNFKKLFFGLLFSVLFSAVLIAVCAFMILKLSFLPSEPILGTAAAVIVGVFFAVSALHIPGIAAYAVTTAFLLLLSVLMHLLLVHWGAKKFERLEA